MLEGKKCFGCGKRLLFLCDGQRQAGEGVSDGFDLFSRLAERLKGHLKEQCGQAGIDGGLWSDMLELLMKRRKGGECGVSDNRGGILECLQKLLGAQRVGGPAFEAERVGECTKGRVRMAQFGVQKVRRKGVPKGGEPLCVVVADVGKQAQTKDLLRGIDRAQVLLEHDTKGRRKRATQKSGLLGVCG